MFDSAIPPLEPTDLALFTRRPTEAPFRRNAFFASVLLNRPSHGSCRYHGVKYINVFTSDFSFRFFLFHFSFFFFASLRDVSLLGHAIILGFIRLASIILIIEEEEEKENVKNLGEEED